MSKNKIATAYVQVMPSMDGVPSKIKQVFTGAGTDSGSAFGGNLVGKIKGLIATAGFGKLLSDSIMAGADLEQSLGGIETLFKGSADTVIKNAEQAYKTAGMSASQYMETVTSFSASLLQGLGGDTEAAAKTADTALKDMSDNANKMGTSMELIQNAYQGFAKQNYTMLDNLKLGYGGTKSEMERLLADAQKLTGVKYDISNLADVYSAVHVIQDELGITGTTAKEASETLSGSFASMKAAASDLMANLALGRDLEGPLTALADTAHTFVVDNLLPAVGRALSALPAVLSTAFSAGIQSLNIAANNADALLQQGIDLVIGIGTSIITALPYLAEAAMNLVAAIGNALVSTDWLQIGQDTINSLRSSLDTAAGEILGTDGNIVQSVLNAITSGLPSILEGGVSMVVEMANGYMEAYPGFLKTVGDLMKQLLNTVLTVLPDILSSGVSLVSQLASGMVSNLPSVIESAASILAELLATIAGHLPDLLAQGIALIGELAAGLIAAIPEVIAAIPKIISGVVDTFADWNWGEIGANIVSGIAKGISSGAKSIWSAAKKAANNALAAAKESLGIASPSRVMRDEVGKFIPSGLAVGIEANTKPLTDAMQGLAALTVNSVPPDAFVEAANPKQFAEATENSAPPVSAPRQRNFTEDASSDYIVGLEPIVELLGDILNAIYELDTSDERYAEAVAAVNRKMAVARGGV